MDFEKIMHRLEGHNLKEKRDERYRSYGILIPLVMLEEQIHILFEVRSLELRNQPGEICFPGGHVDPDDLSPMDAAIRETSEELGIPLHTIQNVKPLDYSVQHAAGRIIYPFVGIITDPSKIQANPSEVKETFMVPLDYLLNIEPEMHSIHFQVIPDKNFPFHLIPGGENYQWKTTDMKEYFYFYKDYCIWGLTAAILRDFLMLINET
ncbi:CoA pyrophosphatase [Caldibacillus lycopersici]|uniref:CoA pyrophosphatase n=1 Tax=Perspicuibacillus lycopersici TaxID=1325689 RepID=A0AAE3IUB6_9BACI|nr:CoA pyrophosphatase [Perspicuibacillus lycopersici]MCU9613564.1 CoA pyrophosphatase [Perspicuibacillus lycopersici]